MRIKGQEYKTIWFENNTVKIIDQTKLPHKFQIKELKSVDDAVNAIKLMEVRGAPLIGGTVVRCRWKIIPLVNNQVPIYKEPYTIVRKRPKII